MALLDDVKSELAAIDNELPIAKKAQATSMIRFGNGLHTVDHHVLVQAQLDSKDAALWLQDTIKNLYGHETTLTPVSRQTPTGIVQRYVIRVPKGSAALVLQTGLYSRYTKNMVLGLPSESSTARSPRSRPLGVVPFWRTVACPTPARRATLRSYVRTMRPPWPWYPRRGVWASRRSPAVCAALSA